MSKRHVCLSIDEFVLSHCKGINLSGLVEHFLRDYLKIKPEPVPGLIVDIAAEERKEAILAGCREFWVTYAKKHENKEVKPGEGERYRVVEPDKVAGLQEVPDLRLNDCTQCAPLDSQGSEGVQVGAVERSDLVCEAPQVQPDNISA